VNITVFTIIYNNYGEFLPDWLWYLKQQTEQPKEIIVVLGKNHGVDKTKFDKVKFIECDSDVMGTLRNEAIRAKRFKKCLYFSVDDELLPNALADIDKKFIQGYKVVGLKFQDLKLVGTRTTPEYAEQVLVGGKNWVGRADKVFFLWGAKECYKNPKEVSFMPYLDAGFVGQNIYLICELYGVGCCFINPNTYKPLENDDYFVGAIAVGNYD